MTSGGRTNQVQANEVTVGRQILCKEDPKTPATSACAKQLTATIDTAKKGLTAEQQKLWRDLVYTSGVLQAAHYCSNYKPGRLPRAEDKPEPSAQAIFANCVNGVLEGTWKFESLFGTEHKWADYLTKGALLIKMPAEIHNGRGRQVCTFGRLRLEMIDF